MATVEAFDRITVEPGKCGGKPCIRGMRITVRRVLELLATYPDRAALLAEYPFWKQRISNRRCGMRQRCRSTLCVYDVRYEWDEAKNIRNRRKHEGISFEVATLVFKDEHCLIIPDRVDRATGERRWHAIGVVEVGGVAILLVVHAYREDEYGEEIIRIISARAAEKREVRRYQKQAID